MNPVLPTMYAKPVLPAEQAAWLTATFAANRTRFGGFRMAEPTEAEKAAAAAAEAQKAKDAAAAAEAEAEKAKGKRDPGVPANYAVTGEGKSLGYPVETPVEKMKPEEQAAYHRHQHRKQEDRNKSWSTAAKGKTPEELAKDLEELETLRKEKMTAPEKAVAEAKEAGKSEARAELLPKLVETAFGAALAHVPEDRRKVLLEGIDRSKFVTDAGEVDTDKVTRHVDAIAPGRGSNEPDYGGGARRSGSSSGVQAGRTAYQERHKKRGAATKS